MATTQDLRKILNEFEASAFGFGVDLRFDLGDLLIKGMKDRGWSQKQLAEAVGKKPSFINRIIHGESNCTFDIAGLLLHAVGIRPSISCRSARLNPFKENEAISDGETSAQASYEISIGAAERLSGECAETSPNESPYAMG